MNSQTAPPVLSTPETHIFEDPTPLPTPSSLPRHSDEELWEIYEISRTAREISEGGYKKVALQFPDQMLKDATRVFEGLERELKGLGPRPPTISNAEAEQTLETNFNSLAVVASARAETQRKSRLQGNKIGKEEGEERTRLYILADTSYGSCCVDEIAAEHVDAEVVIHYGRSCLSPTARLPVVYIFTSHPLPLEPLIETFESTFLSEGEGGKDVKVVLMADITYHGHINSVEKLLRERGWKNLVVPEVIHDPSSIIPNRSISENVEKELIEYNLFHISDPPPALLLTLSSRVKEMFIYPTTITPPSISTSNTTQITKAIRANTALTLRRRYALTTHLSSVPIFGILINTLSVRNYLSTVSAIASLIQKSGKKSYTFVVGKINAAKVANFSEIGGWVVVGCWESSLIESTEFYRPIITPFELELCLQGNKRRVWTGEWRGDFASLGSGEGENSRSVSEEAVAKEEGEEKEALDEHENSDSESESEPPEYDLRTGRYISHSRPMRTKHSTSSTSNPSSKHSDALTKRAKGDLATINGAVSPGAEYLRSQRTWTGLGSDFHEDASLDVELGRSGIARGYTVGVDVDRR